MSSTKLHSKWVGGHYSLLYRFLIKTDFLGDLMWWITSVRMSKYLRRESAKNSMKVEKHWFRFTCQEIFPCGTHSIGEHALHSQPTNTMTFMLSYFFPAHFFSPWPTFRGFLFSFFSSFMFLFYAVYFYGVREGFPVHFAPGVVTDGGFRTVPTHELCVSVFICRIVLEFCQRSVGRYF